MKKLMKLVAALCLLSSVITSQAADGVIRRLVWQVETSDPVPRNWPLTYGETVDLEVRYLDHTRPMELAGSLIVLHARTNGMSTGYSFQATGSVMQAQGWVKVRVAVDSLLPPGLQHADFVIAATQGGTTNLLSASGKFRLTGTGAGIYGAALPAPESAALYVRMDAVSSALSNVVTALSAIPPPSTDAWRLVTPDGNEWRDATGGVWRVTHALETNVVCTFSNPFGLLIAPDYYSAPESAPYISPPGHQIVDNVWIFRFDLDGTGVWEIDNTEFGESWVGYGSTLPITTSVTTDFSRTCYGAATFDYAITPYGPPVTSRVDTVALQSDLAAIPRAPTNAVSGWLVFDTGSNVWLRVSVSNLSFTVWEVTP